MKFNEPEKVILLKEYEYKELLRCQEELRILKLYISSLSNNINRSDNK